MTTLGAALAARPATALAEVSHPTLDGVVAVVIPA